MRAKAFSALILAAFLGAGYAAVDRFLAWKSAEEEARRRLEDLSAAEATRARYPGVFAHSAGQPGALNLKTMVQGSVSRHAVPVVYLNESERELGKGVRERNVVARALGVEHGKWVRFLADLESGGAARIKELRLKPSKERSGAYEEAEAVVCLRWVEKKGKKDAGGL